jgi:hypothetical protein
MKVSVHSDDGEILWWFSNVDPPAGFTSDEYLRDGTQAKIVAALRAAIDEAAGQLSGALQIVDAVPDVRGTPAKINRHVPVSVVWDRDANG